MPIIIRASDVVVGAATPLLAGVQYPVRALGTPQLNGSQSIPYNNIPLWWGHHVATVKNTLRLRGEGAALAATRFSHFPDLEQFIKAVCRWGDYPGVGGRILKNNTQAEIVDRFSKAASILAGGGLVSHALAEINHLHSLGTPSFASKHLMFIRPDICPVLDSFLSKDLGYVFSGFGYQQFSNDCCALAHAIGATGIVHSAGMSWGAADVEMSMFAALRL